MGIRFRLGAILALALAGCANATTGGPDGGIPPGPDATPPGPDAMTPPAPPGEARELTSGGATISGGTFQLDVQVGHGFGQQKMSGGTFTFEGAAAVKR